MRPADWPTAAPMLEAPPEPPTPFPLHDGETVLDSVEKVNYRTRGVFQVSTVFLTNERMVFTKRKGQVVADIALQSLKGIEASKSLQGNNIILSVQGSSELTLVKIDFPANFGKDHLRIEERDALLARIRQARDETQQREMAAASQVADPLPTGTDEPVTFEVSEKTVEQMHTLIAKVKDIIPDYLEKAWAKADRDGDQHAMGEIVLKVNSILKNHEDRIKNVDLNDDEDEVWVHEITSGIVRQSIVERWVITNQRAYIIRAGSDGILRQSAVDGLAIANATVINKHRKSESNRSEVSCTIKGSASAPERATQRAGSLETWCSWQTAGGYFTFRA